MAYEIVLPTQLSSAHLIFHISLPKRYIPDSFHILSSESIDVRPNLSYDETSVKVINRQVKRLKNYTIASVKVIWRCHSLQEATWEVEQDMRQCNSHIFQPTAVQVRYLVFSSIFIFNIQHLSSQCSISQYYDIQHSSFWLHIHHFIFNKFGDEFL